jgi:hypothetical protein
VTAVGAENAGIEILQRSGQTCGGLARWRNRDIEVMCQALASIRLYRDAADRHVLDPVPSEGPEELARVEPLQGGATHRLGSACPVAACSPARSSAARLFQLKASSKRSLIERLRAASTVSGTASGSRTASEGGTPLASFGSGDGFIRSA